jgi:hypothetical protein
LCNAVEMVDWTSVSYNRGIHVTSKKIVKVVIVTDVVYVTASDLIRAKSMGCDNII